MKSKRAPPEYTVFSIHGFSPKNPYYQKKTTNKEKMQQGNVILEDESLQNLNYEVLFNL